MSDERNHELQRHAASVRSLARDLLRDAHAAEDVTQQTLTKAWAVRRQLEPGPLGGWLRRTVTNFTRQWRRGERRRTAREEAHRERSPVDAPPTPAEVLARRETLRKVTDAVLGLDEPYQTVVFLRYFEDLPPRAIARRTNTNVATVKSQLARGLALLRSRLGSDPDTDWRPALAGAFGIPLGSALIPVTTGVLLMKTSVKVAAAAVVLCVGGLMFYDGSEPAPPPVRTDARADDPSGAMAQTLDGERPEDLRRTALSDEVRDEAWLTHPYEVELHVHCVDSLGVPVKNHQPRLSPPNGELLYAEATDEHGVSVVRWRTRQPLVEVEVLDPRRHRRRIALEHGKPAHITLVQDQRAGEFIVYAADGASPRAIRSLSSVLFVPGSDGGPSMGLGLHPHAIFAEQGIVAIEPPETPAQHTELVLGDFAATSYSRISLTTLPNGTLRLDTMAVETSDPTPEPPPSRRALEGTVFGEHGKPIGGVPVLVFGTGPQPLERSKTDEHGRYRIEGLAAEGVTVRAGGDHHGAASAPVSLVAASNRADLHLRREACIRGTLLDGAGEPIAGAQVEFYSDDGRWADRTETDQQGRFVLANLPSQRGEVLVWAKGDQRRFPIAREASVMPGTGELALTGDLGPGSTLRVQPTAEDGCDLADLRLRVRQVEANVSRGISVPTAQSKTTDEDGNEIHVRAQAPDLPWQHDHLPAGFYEVEMWLPGCGSVHLGRHWLDGKADVDLGSVPLPRAGRVRFTTPTTTRPKDLQIELTSLRSPFDVRVGDLGALDGDVAVAAGDYVLATRRGEEPPQFQRFTVARGRTTTVDIGW